MPLLLLQPLHPLQAQPVQLQPQLLGLRADAAAAHHHLQDLQDPDHLGHQPGQSLAAVLVYDALELLPHRGGDVVHVHDGEVSDILLQGRPGLLHVGAPRRFLPGSKLPPPGRTTALSSAELRTGEPGGKITTDRR